MNITSVKKESYESIKGYLDIMLSIVPSLNDLCFIDYNGKRYMMSIDENVVGIVESDNGELNSYAYNLNTLDKITYESEEHEVELILTDSIKEARVRNKLTESVQLLSYLPAVEKYEKSVLSYIQYVDSIVSTLECKYDVSSRGDVNGALMYSAYHTPDIVELSVLKQLLKIFYRKKYVFSKGLNDDVYYQPLFNIGNIYFGSKRYTMKPEYLLDEFSEKGFNTSIPPELASLINGGESEYTKIKTLSDNYRNYIMGQK